MLCLGIWQQTLQSKFCAGTRARGMRGGINLSYLVMLTHGPTTGTHLLSVAGATLRGRSEG